MKPAQTANETSASRTKSAGKEQPTQEQIVESLTEKWSVALGKSIDGVLDCAAILYEAKNTLHLDKYAEWLKRIAKMSEGTASKWRTIHACPFVHRPEYKKLLPPDWTIIYQVSRFSSNDDLDPKKALSLFKEALAYIRKDTPTYAELSAKVNELLGNKPKEKPEVDPVLEQTAQDMLGKPFNKLTLEGRVKVREVAAKDHTPKAEAEVAPTARPDALTGLQVSREARDPLGNGAPTPTDDGEPTPEQIEEAECLAAQDDGVDVDIQLELERFKLAMLKIQIRKLVKAAGITERVRVIVALKATEESA